MVAELWASDWDIEADVAVMEPTKHCNIYHKFKIAGLAADIF